MEGVAKFFQKKMKKRAEVAAKFRAKKSNPHRTNPAKKRRTRAGVRLEKIL